MSGLFFFFKFSIPKCYNIQISIIRQSLTQHLFYIHSIYVRATCFDLVGHPQALQEHRFKRCLNSVQYLFGCQDVPDTGPLRTFYTKLAKTYVFYRIKQNIYMYIYIYIYQRIDEISITSGLHVSALKQPSSIQCRTYLRYNTSMHSMESPIVYTKG